MIQTIQIENFRGIERLEVKGLGRVNLITGKNDCGKTALLEAVFVAEHAQNAGQALAVRQQARRVPVGFTDFDGFWRPVFREGDGKRGFSVRVIDDQGRERRLQVNELPPEGTPFFDLESRPWVLHFRNEEPPKPPREFRVLRATSGVIFPESPAARSFAAWISGNPDIGAGEIAAYSQLALQGRTGEVREMVKLVDDAVQDLSILAPTPPAIFYCHLRSNGVARMLPLHFMGEGFQRWLEMAIKMTVSDAPVCFVDEVENGLHHSTLESLWRWMAITSAQRGIQIFAATHSEDCIQAASHAFTDLKDDGLRVIRLHRREHETRAAVYDRELVEGAERMGIELRG